MTFILELRRAVIPVDATKSRFAAVEAAPALLRPLRRPPESFKWKNQRVFYLKGTTVKIGVGDKGANFGLKHLKQFLSLAPIMVLGPWVLYSKLEHSIKVRVSFS